MSEVNAAPGKRSMLKLIMIIGLILFIFAAAVGVAAYVLELGPFGRGNDAEKAEPEEMSIIKFENIDVNLADPDIAHYLRTSIVLEYADEKLEEEMTGKEYRLKDAIINVLRQKKVGDLDSAEELSQTKQNIVDAVNQELVTGKVSSVFFEALIIQ